MAEIEAEIDGLRVVVATRALLPVRRVARGVLFTGKLGMVEPPADAEAEPEPPPLELLDVPDEALAELLSHLTPTDLAQARRLTRRCRDVHVPEAERIAAERKVHEERERALAEARAAEEARLAEEERKRAEAARHAEALRHEAARKAEYELEKKRERDLSRRAGERLGRRRSEAYQLNS